MKTVDVHPLLDDFRKPSVLQSIVLRAKTILEADNSWFESAEGHYRYIEGRRIGPPLEPSPVLFIKKAIRSKSNSILGLAESYAEYREFCKQHALPRQTFASFKKTANEAIYALHRVRLRHDLPLQDGVKSHGWKHLALFPVV